jgi:hypothetical protein
MRHAIPPGVAFSAMTVDFQGFRPADGYCGTQRPR